MKPDFSTTALYKELENHLPASTVEKRRIWAAKIVENAVGIKELSALLKGEDRIAIRFLWLLTEIGQLYPKNLFAELPYLFALCSDLKPAYRQSFAMFWLVAGVPPENEGQAVALMFELLVAKDTNVTTKTRASEVLLRMTKKYPELKNELRFSLSAQMDRHSANFKKSANKILVALE